jgi:hypothetical protein
MMIALAAGFLRLGGDRFRRRAIKGGPLIRMDGWQTLATKLIDQPIDLAA